MKQLLTTNAIAPLTLALVATLLSGCAAFTSTTNTAAEAAQTIANGMSKASRASTNASVTEPDTPRYAQAVEFVDSQHDPLRREAAAGSGEHIDALAILVSADDANDPAGANLGTWLQTHYSQETHYSQVFAADADAHSVVDRILRRRQG